MPFKKEVMALFYYLYIMLFLKVIGREDHIEERKGETTAWNEREFSKMKPSHSLMLILTMNQISQGQMRYISKQRN